MPLSLVFTSNSVIFKSTWFIHSFVREVYFNTTVICVFWFIPALLLKQTIFSAHFNAWLPEFPNVFSSFCTSCGEQVICTWKKWKKDLKNLHNLTHNQSKQMIAQRILCFCLCGNMTLENIQLLLKIRSKFIHTRKGGNLWMILVLD